MNNDLNEATAKQSAVAPTDPPISEAIRRGAAVISDLACAAILAEVGATTLKGTVPVPSYKVYRDETLAASGNPTDPIEVLLIEEFLWAHHRLGQLHVDAAAAKTKDMIEVYNSAAARLMAELRRSALAMREYRSPVPKQVTVVRQQNVAAGDQQIALVEGGQRPPAQEKNSVQSELGCNQLKVPHVDAPILDPAATSRPAEPAQTPRIDRGRSSTVAGHRPGQPPLAALDGSSNGCGQG